ncbi:MAG: type II toxin-antitoxin system MqsA family antitoxin [Nitrospinae bacterium]|nr:type II toxin-antitoxin system MqsA family antitoxin [Nitrospinota bacterium]
MNCVICKHGEIRPGETTVTLQRGESTIVFKNVPADICPNCGEYYLSDEIAGRLMAQAEEAVRKGAVVEILLYAA